MTGSFAGIWAIGQPSFSLQQWRKELNTLSSSLSNSECSVFWYQWSDQAPWRAHVLAMHAQQRTGIPTANGYSGHFPREQWPFTNPSGQNAFQWIERASYQDHHKARDVTDTNSWCVATLNDKGNVSLRDPKDYVVTTTKKVSKILYQNRDFSIGSKQGDLYLKKNNQTNASRWVLIKRNNIPVASNRGDYQIVNVIQANPFDPIGTKILITDRNIKQRLQYIWTVNLQTGEFQRQTMQSLPQP